MADTAEKPEGAGLWAWLAHHWWVVLATVTVSETCVVIARFMGSDFNKGFTPASIAYNAFVLSVIIVQLPINRHFSRLCVECVARIPVDGERRAERRQVRLWLFHHLHETPWHTMLYYFGWVVFTFVLMWFDVVQEGGPVLYMMATAGYLALVIGLEALALVHRPLVPWCPYCHWGRGGDGPPEVVPDPVPPARSPDRVA